MPCVHVVFYEEILYRDTVYETTMKLLHTHLPQLGSDHTSQITKVHYCIWSFSTTIYYSYSTLMVVKKEFSALQVDLLKIDLPL